MENEPSAQGNAAVAPTATDRHFLHPGSWLGLLRGQPLLPLIALLTVFFFVITGLILRADLKPTAWDITFTHEMQEFPYMPVGIVLIAVSTIGFAPWNWLLAGAISLFMVARRWYTEAVFTAIAAMGSLTAEIVKVLVDRPRPTPDLAQITTVLHSYSFPSGHVTSYASLFGFLFYLTYSALHKRFFLRPLLLTLFGLLILLVGPSRVYMGQHWASDALAGYALGFAYLLGVIQLYRWWTRGHPKAPVPTAAPTG